MGLGVLGIYGTVPFMCSTAQVLTFKDLKVQRAARFASHAVLGQKPVPEYIGPDATTVTFTIQLRSQYGSHPTVYLPLLQTQLEAGMPQTLMLGPDYMGEFILESYSEDRLYHTGLGVCTGADVTLNLREASGFNLLTAAVGAVRDIVGDL